jgi:hypothetical protein
MRGHHQCHHHYHHSHRVGLPEYKWLICFSSFLESLSSLPSISSQLLTRCSKKWHIQWVFRALECLFADFLITQSSYQTPVPSYEPLEVVVIKVEWKFKFLFGNEQVQCNGMLLAGHKWSQFHEQFKKGALFLIIVYYKEACLSTVQVEH